MMTWEVDRDQKYDQAVGLLVLTGKASTSFLQRKLYIGYNDAARLMERAQSEGIVSRPNHVGKRDVLISIAAILALQERLKAAEELTKCPIGITEPSLCSAGTCHECLGRSMVFYRDRAKAAEADADALAEELESIVQWADAYPTKVFPEPDFARAAAALSMAGMSLDAVSASNMRHAISGAGKIARAALAAHAERKKT